MIAQGLRGLEIVFGWLLEASWQAAVLAILVLVVQRVFRSKLNPRWNYLLWLLVVVRLVLPVLPESVLSLFQFAPATPSGIMVTVSQPLFTPSMHQGVESVIVTNAPTDAVFTFYTLLTLGWLVGAVILLIATIWTNRRFALQMNHQTGVSDKFLVSLFGAAKNELGVTREVRLVENLFVQSPAVMGLFRPTLLLPPNVQERFSASELRLIFLHELAHLKRGDVVVQWLIAGLQILHWFNPVLWYAFRRMRIDREPATDALVLSRAGEEQKEHYGEMLIKQLEHFNQRHSIPTLVGILEDKDQFKRRFSLIARFTKGAYGWSLLGVLVIALLAAFCLTKGKEVSGASADVIGRIMDEEGRPIPDVKIMIGTVYANFQKTPAFDKMDWKNAARTDKAGKFHISNAKGVTFLMGFLAPGYAPNVVFQSATASSTITVALTKLPPGLGGISAHGRVVGPQGKIAGADITPDTYYTEDNAFGNAIPYPDTQSRAFTSVTTDAEGNFELPYQKGCIAVSGIITVPGFAPKRFLNLPFNGQTKSYVLDHGVSVIGKVYKQGGGGMPNFWVGVTSIDGSMEHSIREITASTEYFSNFVLHDVPAHTEFELYVKRNSLGDKGVAASKIIKTGETDSILDVGVLTVQPGQKITGTIVLTDGKPLPGNPQLHITREGSADHQFQNLGPDGKFELWALPGERLSFYMGINGYHPSKDEKMENIPVTADMKPLKIIYVPDATSSSSETHGTVTITPVMPHGAKSVRAFIQTVTGRPQEMWVPVDGTQSLRANVPKGEYLIRAVAQDKFDRTYFSAPLLIKVANEPLDIKLDVLPSWRVTGTLDASVPRPVKKGLLVAYVSTESVDPKWQFGPLLWNSTVDIQPDGTFEITNLPEPRRGDHVGDPDRFELVAICDEYASKDSSPKLAEYALGSQSFSPSTAQPIMVAMEPTGSARVRVIGSDGKTVQGARVVFSPSERFSRLWTELGARMNGALTQPFGKVDRGERLVYQGITDENGIAIVKGLPAGIEPYVVMDTPYDMPFRRRLVPSSSKYAQNAVVTISSGVQATTEIQMLPKAAIIPIKNSTSPDGRYTVFIEPSRSSQSDPQSLVVRDAKTNQLICDTNLPYNSQNEIDLVAASEPVKVEWNATSSFFVFTVQRGDHLEGEIIQVGKNGSLSNCNLAIPYVPVAKMLSYEFTGERTLKIKTQLNTGKIVYNYDTVGLDGRVSGH